MSPLVDHLPKVPACPRPKDVLGYYIGAPKKLTHVADLGKYYRALAAASKRVKILPAGTTDEGRECLVVAIADEDTIRNLDTYKGLPGPARRPARPQRSEARRIIAQAKPIYMFTGGLHSAETGPPEMLMELAYRIAVEDSPLYDSIRKNVIVMLTNAAEPDGRDRYVDWYYRYKSAEETEQDRVPGPPYWGKYIFHDNNRDINYSQVTMRNWLKFYLEWHPPIMHDLHESQPLLYTFSGQSPQNPTLDPILYAELPLVLQLRDDQDDRLRHARRLDPCLRGHVVARLSRLHVVQPQRHAAHVRDVRQWRRQHHAAHHRRRRSRRQSGAPEARRGGRGGRGGGMTAREWYRPLPPPRQLDLVACATTPTTWRPASSRRSNSPPGSPRPSSRTSTSRAATPSKSGETEAPLRLCPPAGQPDMTRVAFIVNVLRLQGIEVGRATAEVKLRDGTFPAGLPDRQAQPALRPARQDPAREAELSRPRPHHL